MGKQKADYLLRSDHIFTSTVENPFAGYVAVSGQNILAVGTDDGSDWIDEQTEVLELGDQLVTPGFIDVHTFFTGYAIFHIGIDMSGITSQEEFLQKIKEQAEKEKEQLLQDAQRQADAIVAEGKAAAEAEHARRLRAANAETSALARDMCEKLLARNLTQQDDARLLDDLLQKAGDSNGK